VPQWAAILASFHPNARAYANDRRQGVAACCGRAWSKSYAAAAKFHRPSAAHPRMSSVFVTQSATRSRDILLPALTELSEKFKLGLRYKGGDDNCVFWPNGYRVLFRGCKDRNEANKRRGTPWVVALWDEADAIPGPLLEYDIHECVEPRLVDVNGIWGVSGTPGAVPDGYWYKLSSGLDPERPLYTGDARENTYIPNALKFWIGALKRMGADSAHAKSKWPPGITSLEQILANPALWSLLPAKFVREYLGQWVADVEALIYQVTQANTYVGAIPNPDRVTIGLDLGGATKDKPTLDRCAITVAQSCSNSPLVWVPESYSMSDATPQKLATTVMQMLQRYPDAVVYVDSASAGTIILNGFRAMGLPVMEAVKGPKLRRIQLVQGMLRNGDMQLSRMWNKERGLAACQDLLEEATALVWADNRKDHHPRCKDDCWDSLLYAVIPHLGDYEAEYEPPREGSAEAIKAEEEAEFEAALREAEETEGRLVQLYPARMLEALRMAA